MQTRDKGSARLRTADRDLPHHKSFICKAPMPVDVPRHDRNDRSGETFRSGGLRLLACCIPPLTANPKSTNGDEARSILRESSGLRAGGEVRRSALHAL